MSPRSASPAAGSIPMVSICLPVYNAARFLRDAMESIARQTFRDFEVVVIDDGSSDGSAEIAATLMREHGLLGAVTSQLNSGCEQARDKCVELSSAPILAPFDADDSWSPNYLERMVGIFRRHPEVDLAYCDFIECIVSSAQRIKKSGTTPWIVRPAAVLEDPSLYIFPRGSFFPMLLQGQVLFPPCTMFRREVYERAGGYSRRLPELRISLDWYFGLVASKGSVVAFLDDTLLEKSRHESNVSGVAARTAASDVTVVEALIADGHVPSEDLRTAHTRASIRSLDVAYSLYQEGHRAKCRTWLRRSLRHEFNRRAVRLFLMSIAPRSLVENARRLARDK